jgi:hypothetical protein
MIELTQGNILKADAEAPVNTVNCVGFMNANGIGQAQPEAVSRSSFSDRVSLVQPLSPNLRLFAFIRVYSRPFAVDMSAASRMALP